MKSFQLPHVFELPLYLVGTALIVALVFFLAPFLTPLLVAALLCTMMEPLIRKLSRRKDDHGRIVKRGLPRKLAVVLSMLLVLSLLALTLFFIIAGVVNEVSSLAALLPQKLPIWTEKISTSLASLRAQYDFLSPDTVATINGLFATLSTRAMEWLSTLMTSVVGSVTKLPNLLLFLVVTVMATYFLAADRKEMARSLRHNLPERWLTIGTQLYNTLIRALWGWVKAQLLIMLAMFVIMLIGLMILKSPYALLLAAGIALFDVLPILGSGLILLPWGLYQLLFSSQSLGIGLLVLFVVSECVRQFLEPRILGDRFGLSPLLTMVSMYAGLKAIGFFGLLVGPFIALLFVCVIRAYLDGRTYAQVIDPPPKLT